MSKVYKSDILEILNEYQTPEYDEYGDVINHKIEAGDLEEIATKIKILLEREK